MSQEQAATGFLMEKLNAIEARLESIERILGAESKPEQQEPEWRPMSTAPKDRDIEVKVNGEVNTAWYYGKEEWNVSGYILHEVYISGWRPL